jgi:hypothetical protein
VGVVHGAAGRLTDDWRWPRSAMSGSRRHAVLERERCCFTARQMMGSIVTSPGERNRGVAPRDRNAWPSPAGDDIRR